MDFNDKTKKKALKGAKKKRDHLVIPEHKETQINKFCGLKFLVLKQ